MNKDLIISLLTGVFAKGLRYAIASVGGAIAAGSNKDAGVDIAQLASGAATVLVSLIWSWWDARVRSIQTVQALQAVAAGSTPLDATSNTATLVKAKQTLEKQP
jgi:hypothetical protein